MESGQRRSPRLLWAKRRFRGPGAPAVARPGPRIERFGGCYFFALKETVVTGPSPTLLRALIWTR
jgi:hypothetical protein